MHNDVVSILQLTAFARAECTSPEPPPRQPHVPVTPEVAVHESMADAG
jgi:hypothetical protein